MTELARNGRELGRVLEVGTGCGYQAAVLGQVAREVVSIERIAALVGQTRKRQRELRLHNIKLKHGDGMQGYAEGAPYDAIVIAAASHRYRSAEDAARRGRPSGHAAGRRQPGAAGGQPPGNAFQEEKLEAVNSCPCCRCFVRALGLVLAILVLSGCEGPGFAPIRTARHQRPNPCRNRQPSLPRHRRRNRRIGTSSSKATRCSPSHS